MLTSGERPLLEPTNGTAAKVRIILGLVLVLLACIYAVQLVRPLHLESDSVCYLQIAERGAAGRGYSCPGCNHTHCPILYPPGYPWILAQFIRAGIAGAKGFVLLNLACLGIALVAAAELWRRAFGLTTNARLLIGIVFLLSWPVFRLANTPLSEFVFLALAITALLAATVSAQSSALVVRVGALTIAVVLAAAAIEVRTVGIALLPAIVWAAVGRVETRAWVQRQFAVHRAALLIIGAVVFLLGATAVARSQYVTRDLRTQYREGIAGTLLHTWGFRLTEFGELALNVPAGKLPEALQPVVSATGAVAVLLLGWLLLRRRRRLGPAEVFVCAVAGIMCIWPFEDARFWIPAMPVFLGLVGWGAATIWRGRYWRTALVIVCSAFLALGAGGEAYNTVISFSGNRFPLRFSDDYLGPAYRAAWGTPIAADSAVVVDSTALRLIRQFEPRARSR